MTNISAVEKMAELMQQMEENSPRVAALQYCLSEVSKRIAELELKLAESQREFRAADATIENLQMQLNAEREAKLALSAESAGLKEACGGDGSYRDCPACAHSEYIEAPDTQATDAFLAEVRAQGVDMCSAEIQKQTWDEREGDGIVAAIDAMEIYALQLRKGVQS
ncbi:TPA: hypothetical protein I4D82_03175 [Enterobacter cloacae]|nr:hypothetical protein [Enterobacter cloacae]